MLFSSSRSTSKTSFRNLHMRINRPRGQSSELWGRATEPPGGPAKRPVTKLTCRCSRALDEPSIARSSEQSLARL